jgi:biotin synthase
MLEAGIDWYNLCEPIGPEHSPEELAEQIWLGVEMPCIQHGALQRFPVPGSPLYSKGMISLQKLGQIVAVIVLATLNKKELKYISAMLSSFVGLFSGANVIYSETGEPLEIETNNSSGAGFSSAQWRQSNEITTLDCRNMLAAAGFFY